MAAKKTAKKTAAKRTAKKTNIAPVEPSGVVVAGEDPTPFEPLRKLEVATEALQFARHRLRVANSYNDKYQRAAKVEEASKEVAEAEAAYEKAKKDVRP